MSSPPVRPVIRPAHPADADTLSALHDVVWRETYGELMSEAAITEKGEYNARRWPQRLTDPAGPAHWVALVEDEIVGFAWAVAAGPHLGPDSPPRNLELVALYVQQSHQGIGIGRRLLEITVSDAPCYLWVAAHNDKAQRFYSAAGFSADGARRAVPSWDHMEILRMVR